MTLTSGKIKPANDRQLFLPKNLKWHLVMPTCFYTNDPDTQRQMGRLSGALLAAQ
jgi:hypothetical protein